jgi:hypothetical protein
MGTFEAEKNKRLSVRKDESGIAEIETQEFLVLSYIQMFSFKRYFKIKKKYCSISTSKCNGLPLPSSPLKGTTI